MLSGKYLVQRIIIRRLKKCIATGFHAVPDCKRCGINSELK